MNSQRFKQNGWTLIELLVVIGIIIVLVSLLFPVVGRVKDKAGLAKCRGQLRQLGLATRVYADDHQGRLPIIRRNPDMENSYPLVEKLLSYVEGEVHVFRCPKDPVGKITGHYSSYEWNTAFNGKLIDKSDRDSSGPSPMLYDREAWHPASGKANGKNAYFSDETVDWWEAENQ